jgi:hypothetical protein
MSRGLVGEPGAVLSRAISVVLACISGSSGTSVVASLMLSSSKAPSGMSCISSRAVATIDPNDVVTGGSDTSGGTEGRVEMSQRR